MLFFGTSAEHISGPGVVPGMSTGKDSGAYGTVAQWVDSRSWKAEPQDLLMDGRDAGLEQAEN